LQEENLVPMFVNYSFFINKNIHFTLELFRLVARQLQGGTTPVL